MEIQTVMGHSASSVGSDSSRGPSQDSSQKLHLCLRRMHGKSVVASPLPVPPEGVVMGGDTEGGENVALAASLHVVTRHALVRAAQAGEEGAWHIEPGNKAMVLAVNDARVPWGENCPLQHGDRLEVGFACFEVAMEADLERFQHDAVKQGVFQKQNALVAVGLAELAGMAGLSLDAPVAAKRVAAESEGSTKIAAPIAAAIAAPGGEPLPSLAPFVPLLLQPMPSTISNGPEFSEAADPSEAELLAAMLAEGAESQALTESAGLATESGSDVLAAIVREAEPVPPAPDPDDILAELVAESQRALVGGGLWGTSSGAIFSETDYSGGYAVSATHATDDPDPFQAGAAMASVEEIVEGRLTIDDVLDRLRQRHGAMGNDMLAGMGAIVKGDTGNASNFMDGIAREPDPLLLLAGMENQPVREPELAPVLHREHSATGIRSPYRLGAAQTAGRVAGENKQSEQEESCPLPR